METQNQNKFTLGLDAGYLGRGGRLILGGIIPLWSLIINLLGQQLSTGVYVEIALYFILIFSIYLAAHYYLGERLLAKTSPWIGTIILVVPPTIALIMRLGPPTFQVALAAYVSISLVFNFIMSYGGCEVMAIPSLVFQRRYVVYCPWNAIDVVDKVIADRKNIKIKNDSEVGYANEGN